MGYRAVFLTPSLVITLGLKQHMPVHVFLVLLRGCHLI